MNVTITDRQEKKPYCGISSSNIDDVGSFLRKNLEKIKKIELTFSEKILVRLFKKTFCKVYVESLKNFYKIK